MSELRVVFVHQQLIAQKQADPGAHDFGKNDNVRMRGERAVPLRDLNLDVCCSSSLQCNITGVRSALNVPIPQLGKGSKGH